jgi:hypothetical protein
LAGRCSVAHRPDVCPGTQGSSDEWAEFAVRQAP